MFSSEAYFTTYFFLRDKLPINMKMLVFFLAKCVRTAVKTMVVDRKNQNALAVLYFVSIQPLRKAANSSGVPTEFATEPIRQIWTFRLNFITLFLSPELNFSPSTKKTTEYSFELFFPLTNFFLTFAVFACFATTRVNMRFRAKNTGFSRGLYPVNATSYWWPCDADGRTVTCLLRHYQNFLAW